MDKISGVDRGSIRWERKHSRNFRDRLLALKADRLTRAALEQEEAERQEQEREAQQREAAKPAPGGYADGRRRWEAQHQGRTNKTTTRETEA